MSAISVAIVSVSSSNGLVEGLAASWPFGSLPWLLLVIGAAAVLGLLAMQADRGAARRPSSRRGAVEATLVRRISGPKERRA